MGWKDNCQECGGHPNVKRVLLHKKGCSLFALSSAATMPLDRFSIGLLQNLTAIQASITAREITKDVIEKSLDLVVQRFSGEKVLAKIPTAIYAEIVNAVKKELDADE